MILDVVRVLLYLALAASLSVYAWRAYRHLVHHETRRDREARRREAAAAKLDGPGTAPPADSAPARADGSGPAASPAIAGGARSAGGRDEPGRTSRRDRAAAAKVPVESVEDGAMVRDVIRQELAKKQGIGVPAGDATGGASSDDRDAGSDGGGGRSGLFAKSRPPVAELLTGIQLPCDLAPLMDRDEIDPSRAVFATAGHSPATVATALADELERLGFLVDSVGDNEAVARKPEGDLRVTIHTDLAAFPTAPGSGVVVELTT